MRRGEGSMLRRGKEMGKEERKGVQMGRQSR